MYSVTSEAAAISFQAAPKPTRPDQSQGNGSFESLVGSNMPADADSDRAAMAAQAPSASQRRADDAATTADSNRSRDAASADQAAKNASDDRDARAQQASGANAAADANANANADTNTDAVRRSGRIKSNVLKADAAKSADKPPSDNISAADPAAPVQQSGAPVTTPGAVAVAITTTIVSTDVPAATPASGTAAAPLAIAAAAIAASAQAIAAPAASSAQIKIDSEATTAATASAADTASTVATANANTAAIPATAKIAVQAAASETNAASVKQQVTQTDAAAATDTAALTAAVAATTPVAPKTTLLKAMVAAPGKTAISGAANTTPGATDPSATATPTGPTSDTVAPPPAAVGKQAPGNGIVDGAKADVSASASATVTTAIVAAHERSSVAGTAHASTDLSDTGVQAPGMIQPQLPTVATSAASAAALSVTAATNAPVPLSGLALEIAVSAQSGKSRFEIRLDPAELGRIDVRIDVDRNGQVTSHLTVERPETLSMLRQDAPQLQRQLDDAGFKTGDGGLQFSLRDQSSSGQNNGNETRSNAQRLVIGDEDTIPAAVAGRSYGRMLGSSSGVDIRV